MAFRSRDRLQRYAEAVRAEAAIALDELAVELVRQLQNLLETPGRGRIRGRARTRVGVGSYRRVKNGDGVRVLKRKTRGVAKINLDLKNRHSAPGDPPAPDWGDLVGSITFERTGLRARVGTGLAYGRHLEFGTAHIAPRPFMRPALAAFRPLIGPRAAEALRRARARVATP